MIGSREQDLTGDDIIMRQISVAVHGRKDVSDERAVSSTTGCGAAVVSARTSSTLRYRQKMIQHMSACSVAVPPTLHVIFILDSCSTVPIGCHCHRPRIYAVHSSIAGRLSRSDSQLLSSVGVRM